jgi:hypothetical protein
MENLQQWLYHLSAANGIGAAANKCDLMQSVCDKRVSWHQLQAGMFGTRRWMKCSDYVCPKRVACAEQE